MYIGAIKLERGDVMDGFIGVVTAFWGFLMNVLVIFGIVTVPATFYGVLIYIKNAAAGKPVKEYLKAFILTVIGLLITVSPLCMIFYS